MPNCSARGLGWGQLSTWQTRLCLLGWARDGRVWYDACKSGRAAHFQLEERDMTNRAFASLGVAIFCAIGGGAAPARAQQLVSAVSATTDMGSGFATNLLNTINGNGLSSLSLTATHTGTTPANSWVSAANVHSGQITFNLGGTFAINGFSFWNQNGGGPGPGGATGINGVTVLRSTDGVNFFPIAGAPTAFAQQPASTLVPPEIFSFAPVNASFIRFQVAGNWGDPGQTGFGEVQFSAVPAPSTLLIIAAFGGAALRHRR
jgi:hypothetical protein